MNLRKIAFLLFCSVAAAQNKTDLGTGVKGQLDLSAHVAGQLPVADATDVIAQTVALVPAGSQNVRQPAGTLLTLNGGRLCGASGTGCAPSLGGSFVGTSPDGSVTAENGSSEKFFADYRPEGTNTDGSTHVAGWDYEANVAVTQGHLVPAADTSGDSKPMDLVRSLLWDNSAWFFAQGNMYFGLNQFPNTASCIGFNNAAVGKASTGQGQQLAVCFGNNTAYLVNGSSNTTTIPFPNRATWCTVTLWVTPDHANPSTWDISISIVQIGTSSAVTYTATSVAPLANVTNFEVSGQGSNDLHYNTRYAVGGNGATEHWNIAADDTHWGLTSVLTSNTASGVYVLIPPAYRPGRLNRAVVYMHGLNEPGYSISCQAPYTGCNAGVSNVAQGLLNAGYVVIGINQTNAACFGNATCLAELQQAIAETRARLSLAPGLYGYAESMGGFEMLNAIGQGLVSFRAAACMDCNTNLADDYFPNYQMPDGSTATEAGTAGPAAPGFGVPNFIDPAYGISGSNPYATATAGFDPQLMAQQGGAPLANYVGVPMAMWSSYSDQAVWRQANTDLFAATVNAAGGQIQVQTCTGLHEDVSCFQPAAVAAFFNLH